MQNQWVEGVVVDKRRWKDNLFSLAFEAPMGEFEAGQFTQLALDIEGERVARPYSLVNPPHRKPLEVYLNVVSDGPLSSRLYDLEPGDRLWVSARANGFFTLKDMPPSRDLWLIATGTALGVYLSILRTPEAWERYHNIVLVHGVRYADELSYAEELAELQHSHPERFRLLTTISRQHAAGRLYGRVTDLLERGSLERSAGLALTPEDSHVMLCGNMDMIRDAIAILHNRGLQRHRVKEPGHFTTEKYH